MPEGKTLYLMRHAEAAWMNSGQRDFERLLDLQGERDAGAMGKRLKQRGVSPDLILSSPALRAAQTSKRIALELSIPLDEIVFHEAIYEATVSDLLKIIQALDDHYGSAMLIGHNPALTWLINQLTGKHMANAPTCSIATLRTFSPRWEDTAFETADLLGFDFPEK
jgi:phosphohistidine phosphatase